MKLSDFKTEQWMNEHEGNARFNMTDTCVAPLTFTDLIQMDDYHLLEKVKMDYGEIPGDSHFRKEVLSLYKTGSIDNILLFQGCLQANESVMMTLLSPGDTVVTFSPGYQQFVDIPRSLGCHVIEIPLHEENSWQPDWQEIKAVMDQKVNMIIINNPSNPTGTLFHQDLLSRMITLAKKQNTWILADEVYQGLCSKEAAISDLYDHGISTSSLSKIYSCAGLRLGWVKASKELIHLLSVRRDYSIISTGSLIDTCGTIVLSHKQELLNRSKEIVNANKAVITEWLKSEKRCSIVMPEAGTVGFLKYNVPISSAVLAQSIQEKYGVFFVPGSCFDAEYHLRLGFTNKPEVTKQGLVYLSQFMNEAI